MSSQLAKLGVAALMAIPALAAPMPQVTVYQTATTVVVVGPDGQPVVAQQAAQTPAPSQYTPAPWTPTPAQSSYAAPAPSSSDDSSAASYPTTTSSPASGGSSSGGSKKGLVYTKDTAALAMATQIASASNGEITWMYDWEGYQFIDGQGSSDYSVGVDGVEFVPMLHSADSMFTSAWSSANPGPQGSSAQHALFINEPDNSGSACDANEAASLYKSTFMPGAPSAKLGGPATTRGTGLPWLQTFIPACQSQGCQIDFMPFHYYSDDGDLDEMKKEIQAIHDYVQMPMWITEFGLKAARDGGSASADDRANFIQQASDWFDSQDWIERYAPYQVSDQSSDDSMQPGNAIAKAYTSSS